MINFDDIFSRVEKVNAAAGDVLIFYIKTDDAGLPYLSLDEYLDIFNTVKNFLDDKNVSVLFMIDKVCLFSVENANEAKEHLKKCVSYIQEAVNKAGDIENGKFRNPIQVQFYCKDAEGQTGGSS